MNIVCRKLKQKYFVMWQSFHSESKISHHITKNAAEREQGLYEKKVFT